jgi:transposase-like protein
MEIITGVERHRRWRLEEKLRIIAKVEQPGACFAEVARPHDVSRGLLWNWRRQVRCGVWRGPLQNRPLRTCVNEIAAVRMHSCSGIGLL